jgi:tRNA A-37 threonylcarbamoyl transferase component Bud32
MVLPASEEEGRYQYPNSKRVRFWYRFRDTRHVVLLDFTDGFNDERDILRALKLAYTMNTSVSLKLIRRDILFTEETIVTLRESFHVEQGPFETYIPRFNNSGFPAIDEVSLTTVKQLKRNIEVVSFNQQLYVHKFMTLHCQQISFETEVQNYIKLAGARGLPMLHAVVYKNAIPQGLLISYINGIDLWSAIESNKLDGGESQLFDITYRIIHLAADLEERGFYHEDLKCSNIIYQDSDGQIFFVDFAGGLTKGMYREDRLTHLVFNGPEACDALFCLGRTLWELWAADWPAKEGAPLHKIHNETIQNIIKDCECGNVDSIAQLRTKYCS